MMKKKRRFFFWKKMVIIQFSYKKNCVTSIFLIATTKSNIEIAPKIFFVFFEPQVEFCTQRNILQKKIW